MRKLIKKYLLIGITVGCCAVVVNGILRDLGLMGSENSLSIFENFTSFAIGIIGISIGFISTGVVYEIKQLSFRLKLLIHLTVGIGMLLVIGFNIFTFDNLLDIATNVGINALILLAVWTYYYIRDKREIEKINERIEEKKLQRKLDTE